MRETAKIEQQNGRMFPRNELIQEKCRIYAEFLHTLENYIKI